MASRKRPTAHVDSDMRTVPPGMSMQMLQVPDVAAPMVEAPGNQGAQDSAP